MPTFSVRRKLDHVEVTRYASSAVALTDEYPLDDFEHVEFSDGVGITPAVRDADWHIHVGPFYDRFGAYKLPILASADAIVQAIIRDTSVRKYIDLRGRRAELAGAIALLQSKGFAVNAEAILDVQPTPAEVYRG